MESPEPGDRPKPEDWSAWWSRVRDSVSPASSSPVHWAWSAGKESLSPVHAFMSGYQAAMQCLPGIPGREIRGLWALAVTDEPTDAVAVTMAESDVVKLGGRKTFLTCPDHLEGCIITARRDDRVHAFLLPLGADDRPRLGNGVPVPELEPLTMGTLDCSHWIIPAAAELPVDGHREISVRFRWLEDILVTTALSGWLAGQGLKALQQESGEDASLREGCEQALLLRRALAELTLDGKPSAEEHLVLAAAQARLAGMVESWNPAREDGARGLVHRRALGRLMRLASRPRQKRREKAWVKYLATIN